MNHYYLRITDLEQLPKVTDHLVLCNFLRPYEPSNILLFLKLLPSFAGGEIF